jgi:hypothetical protein
MSTSDQVDPGLDQAIRNSLLPTHDGEWDQDLAVRSIRMRHLQEHIVFRFDI